MESIVSVIIPTYNRARLLEKAIRSVLSQIFRDFEIVVINDASADNTTEMIKDKFNFEMEKSILRYYRNEENKGLGYCRNKGIGLAKGKYIALLDDDDTWLPEHLKILIGYLEEHKDVGCVFSNCAMIKGDGSSELGVKNLESYKGFSYRELCILGILAATCTSVFRKQIYKNIGGFRENLNHGENRELYSRIALNYPIHYIEKITSCQYRHKGSYFKISPEDYAYSREKIWKLTEENSSKFKFLLRKEVVSRAYINIAWFFLPNVPKTKKYLFKAIKKTPKLIIKLDTLRLLLRVIFGQKFYFVLKELRKIVNNQ